LPSKSILAYLVASSVTRKKFDNTDTRSTQTSVTSCSESSSFSWPTAKTSSTGNSSRCQIYKTLFSWSLTLW